MDAIDFNPWWETGAIDSETLSMKSRKNGAHASAYWPSAE